MCKLEGLSLVHDNLTGSLLIAPPLIKTGFWAKSIVLVTEHQSYGSTGLIINKRSQVSLKEFGSQLGIPLKMSGHVHVGGPINVRSLILLHTSEWYSDNTLFLNSDISISSDDTILPRLATGDIPKRWRLIMGMCKWEAGQLESEINGFYPKEQDISWCFASGDPQIIFGYDSTQQWTRALDHAGLEFSQKLLDY